MTGSADDPRSAPEDGIHADWSITREDIQRWYASHPDAFPGFDVAPIILNERRQAAVHKARAARPDLDPAEFQLLADDELPKLSDHHKSMVAELMDRIAAHRPLPSKESAVPDARLSRRGSGRPAWTRELFLEHWQEAMDRAAPRHRLADIATEFRALDGAKGMDLDSLRRLRRRFMPKSANRSPAVRSVRE